MSLPVWPTGLPSCPLLGSQQVPQTAEAPVRSEMNSGTTRSRRKYSLRIAHVSFALRMTNAQVATFLEFHEVTLGDGAARFTMPILFAGASAARTVQFADQPSYESLGGGRTKVGISLLVENISAALSTAPSIPDGALLLPDNTSAFLLPDGSSFFLRP